jgi:hypothetical protein
MYWGFCLDLDGDTKRNSLMDMFCIWWLASLYFTSQSHMVVNVGL